MMDGNEGAGVLGLVGDVHAEDQLLRVALEHLRDRGVDLVLCAGDIVDGPGSVERCVDLLAEHRVMAVRGNHERWFLSGRMRELRDATTAVTEEARRYLQTLPATRELATPMGSLLLCHGLGDNDMVGVRPHDEGIALYSNDPLQELMQEGRHRLVVNGHTHRAMVRHFDDLIVVNAGTLAPEGPAGFMVLDLPSRRVEPFGFDGEGAPRPLPFLSLQARGEVLVPSAR